ncbi:LacI family transcriptional regulator [Rhizobium sp. P38BS-XIX]|uniref:substrate-binding domain-containing protein n=1 Tax=Rhizobium sp. P38BS-XIX TaxID=2726740 RepID=UPI001456B73F|nr:LacI family transcriptional regulator [Rhizobium sp. P38BS-XIX]
MGKVTLKDVAAAAGVGPATVERALNGRGNVSPETAEKILIAAKRLGYRAPLAGTRHGLVRIEVVLLRPETYFYSRLNRAFERIAALLDKDILIQRTFAKEDDPVEFSRHIMNPQARRSALIVVAPDHPDVVGSVRKAAGGGIPVVQIMTRPAPELAYVGIDNEAAGRTAAFYMTRMQAGTPGRFVALCHSGAYENHKARIRGFSDYLLAHANPGHRFVEVMFDEDDEMKTMEMLSAAFARYPDLCGLYSAGGDNAAIATILLRHRKQSIFWVGHELSEATRGYLKEGLMTIVLDQAPEVQARRAVDLTLKRLGLIDTDIDSEPVRFLTMTSEGL